MRAAACVAVLVLVAVGASAAIVQRQDVQFDSASKATPVAMAAGASGTTTLGTSLASAATTRAGLPVSFQQVLVLQKDTTDWDVRIRLDQASGFGALDSATVQLSDGIATANQVVVSLGSVTQSIGSILTLAASGSDLSIRVVGTKTSAGPLVLSMTVLVVPSGDSLPALSLPYTLTIT